MQARELLGWNLRRLRVERGLSQERLALEAGINRAYVGRIERGEENVSITIIEALNAALNVPVVELFSAPSPDACRPSLLRSGRRLGWARKR